MPGVPAPAVEIESLQKSFGSVRALDGLTLRVESGAVGLLGRNGAGKTTLLKLLLGLVAPDGGTARVAGFDPRVARQRLALRRAVGYMPEGDCLAPGSSAVELVSMLGRLSGVRERDAVARAHEVLDYVGLDEARYRDADGYSTGMKQRLKLAQALVHDPALLLLDEPTNGLDPAGREHMLELVHDLGAARGKTLFVCTHLLPDVERTCRDVVVLEKGRVVARGAIAELLASDGRIARVVVEGDGRARLRAELERRGLAVRDRDERSLDVVLPQGTDDADVVFEAAETAAAPVAGLDLARASLEDVFLRALGREALP